MSTLRTNALEGVDAKNSITIVAGAGNITTTNVQEGLAKAFHHSSNAAVVTDSFNVASGTDNATGDYTYAYTNNMRADDSYSSPHTGNENNDTFVYTRTTGASSIRVDTINSGGSNVDRQHSGTIHGDLA